MRVKYQDLGLKINDKIETIKIGENEINIKQYLETDKKAAIVRNAVNAALFEGYVDEILSEAYLHMMIVENYTDIDFGEEEFSDILQTFDELVSSGVLDQIIGAIDPSEYNYLVDSANKTINVVNTYNQSYAAALQVQADLLKAAGMQNNETE